MKKREPFTNNENDPKLVKVIAEFCWWQNRIPKKGTPETIAEKFNLTREKVDKLLKSPEYRDCVLSLMIGQRATVGEFTDWVNKKKFKTEFPVLMGLKPEDVPSLVKRAAELHAKISAGEMTAPAPMPTPPERREGGKAYNKHKRTLYRKQEGNCNGCCFPFPFRNLAVDHITPQSRGGTDHIENLQLLCQACNSTKGKGTQAQLIAKLKADGILPKSIPTPKKVYHLKT